MNEKFDTEIKTISPFDVQLLEKNARYMTAAQIRQLTKNVEQDGCLTSVPLCWYENGQLVVGSGNHRVTAARKAGLKKIQVMVIKNELNEKQKVAIQLSHNAITGQDDPSLLFDLYDSLDLEGKLYSGLTDDDFDNLPKLDTTGLSVGGMKYQEILLTFLEDEEAIFIDTLKRIEKSAAKGTLHFLNRNNDFDRFFDTLIKVKNSKNIHNTAFALNAMSELALERLQQLESEQEKEPHGEKS